MTFPCALAAGLLATLATSATPATFAPGDDARTASVGRSASLDEVVLPGSLLETRPADAKTPLILRIARVSPHGTAFRYDLAWVGLEPGAYDLRDFLQRVDGTSADDLPPLPVTVTSVLADLNARPTAPPMRTISGLGGYRFFLIAAGVLWSAGLVVLVLRSRRTPPSDTAGSGTVELSFEERLRGLVEQAARGPLTPRQRAELELALVQQWRRKLDLEGFAPAEAFQKLKAHPESAACIQRLEEWLHKPHGPHGPHAPGTSPPPDVIDLKASWIP